MLKHGRAGVPMEVMGLMLGEFVDEYTGDRYIITTDRSLVTLTLDIFAVRVIDVFAMPQSGTGVSVEAVDPVFQVIFIFLLNDLSRVQPPILLHRPKCWTC